MSKKANGKKRRDRYKVHRCRYKPPDFKAESAARMDRLRTRRKG